MYIQCIHFTVDVRVPFYTEFVTQGVLFCLTQVGIVCVVFPWFVLPLSVILAAFFGLDHFMNRGVLWTRKLDNATKSPVLHHLSSAMAGLAVIRGYGRQEVFQRRFNADLNAHVSANALNRYANRWFTFRMDLFGMVTIVVTAVFVIIGKSTGATSAAIAGEKLCASSKYVA